MDMETNPILSPTLPEEASPEVLSADCMEPAALESDFIAELAPDVRAETYEPDLPITQDDDTQPIQPEPTLAEAPAPLPEDSPPETFP